MSNKNKFKKLTEKRNKNWLKNTDWMAANVENILTDDQHAEILEFRQEIRDSNKTNEEKGVLKEDHTTWLQPTIPSWININDIQD